MKHKTNPRVILCSFLAIAICLAAWALREVGKQTELAKAKQTSLAKEQKEIGSAISQYKKLNRKIQDYKDQGVDTGLIDGKLTEIKKSLFKKREYATAKKLINEANSTLNSLMAEEKEQQRLAEETRLQEEMAKLKAEEEAKTKGNLVGTVKCGSSPCASVTVRLSDGSTTVASAKTEKDGSYTINVDAGKYSLSASTPSYQPFSKPNVTVEPQKETDIDITLNKVVAGTTPTSPSAPTPASPSNPTPTNPPAPTPAPEPTSVPVVPSTPPPATPIVSTSCDTSNQTQKLLCLINNYRKEKGLGQLALDPLISAAATKHSQWMNDTGNFSHTGQNGSSPWDRCSAEGTTCSAENIAMTSGGADSAFDLWKNSPGHNANMLGNYTVIGIGIVGSYYTNDFR